MQHTSSPDKQQEEPEVGKVLTSPLIITKLSYPNITAHESTKKTSAIPRHSALSQLGSPEERQEDQEYRSHYLKKETLI